MGAAASWCSRMMPAGEPRKNSTSPGIMSWSPPTSVIQLRSRRMAMTRIPATTGSSRSARGRRTMCDPSRTTSRCDTSSALDMSATSSAGIPSWRVTMREMSTASLAIRSMALITWSTDDMPSASRGWRTAMMHTARMSCTNPVICTSSSSTSVAMPGSPKYRAA